VVSRFDGTVKERDVASVYVDDRMVVAAWKVQITESPFWNRLPNTSTDTGLLVPAKAAAGEREVIPGAVV